MEMVPWTLMNFVLRLKNFGDDAWMDVFIPGVKIRNQEEKPNMAFMLHGGVEQVIHPTK